MHHRSIAFLTAALLAASCGGSDSPACDGGADGGCASTGGGSGGASGAGGSTGTAGSSGAPASLQGQFDLTWTVGGQTFTIAGRSVKLTLKDNGPDETNYDAQGTATISPTSFTMSGTTCTLAAADATVSWSESYWFKVLKPFGSQTTYAQRWGFVNEWDYTCGGSPWPVIVNFKTGTGTACGTPSDVPAASATALSGTFDMTCMAPAFSGQATWSFAP